MTGQLLRVTSVPYQSVRLSQSARLVSSDSVDLERRKAIARMRAFQSQHSPGGGSTGANYDFVKQINRAFSLQSSQSSTPSSPQSSNVANSPSEHPVAVDSSSGQAITAEVPVVQTSGAETVSSPDIQEEISTGSGEINSSYIMERGAFEFKVSTGEVAFVPSFSMTIMTQRPEIHFEYLGGHNYVPPEKFDDNGFMNLLA